MNRRALLKALSALAAAVLPVSKPWANDPKTPIATELGEFAWIGPKYFEFAQWVGVGLRLPNGRWHFARRPTWVNGRRLTDAEEAQLVAEMKGALLAWAERMVGKA